MMLVESTNTILMQAVPLFGLMPDQTIYELDPQTWRSNIKLLFLVNGRQKGITAVASATRKSIFNTSSSIYQQVYSSTFSPDCWNKSFPCITTTFFNFKEWKQSPIQLQSSSYYLPQNFISFIHFHVGKQNRSYAYCLSSNFISKGIV